MLTAKQTGHQQSQMEPRPEEIATRRFSRKFFGVHPGEVRGALLEVAAALDRSQSALAHEISERRALERSLEAASVTIQELQQQVMTAKAELRAGQDREGALARELLAATEVRSRPRQANGAQADEIMGFARQAANTIMENARTAALEVLRAARTAAQAISHPVDVVLVIGGRLAPDDDS